MRWSWRVGRIAGIDFYIHWTFLILLGWLLFIHLRHGEDLLTALKGVGGILAIFGCVVLHELGHALAARRFGIPTQDITLLPIGGLARLQRMPEKPLQELWVAIAGPLVNVGIAAVAFLLILVTGPHASLPMDASNETLPLSVVHGSFLMELMVVNIFLVLFNMLPAFPMDGGRVLRALLAMQMDYVRATQVAAAVGQLMAILFFFAGFLIGNPFLMFIALFVYVGAQSEAATTEMQSAFRGIPVGAAMITRFRTLTKSDTLETAIRELLSGTQKDFPVIEGDQFLGMLPRAELLKALGDEGRDGAVGDVIQTDCLAVEKGQMLEGALQQMREKGCSTVPVVEGGRLIGMLDLENVGEFMMIHSALKQWRTRSDVTDIYSGK